MAENTHMQVDSDKDKLTVDKSTVYLSTSSSAKNRVASPIGIARDTRKERLDFGVRVMVHVDSIRLQHSLQQSRQGSCLRIRRFSLHTKETYMAQPILFDSI